MIKSVVSVGLQESKDIETVVKYLYRTNKVGSLGLWGR